MNSLPSATPARGSQCERVLAVLNDGNPKSIQTIHAAVGPMRLNSRIAELRKRGHDIRCWKAQLGRDSKGRDTWTYYYRLVTLAAAESPLLSASEDDPPGSAAASVSVPYASAASPVVANGGAAPLSDVGATLTLFTLPATPEWA